MQSFVKGSITSYNNFVPIQISSGQLQLVTEQCPGGYTLTFTGGAAQTYKTCSCLVVSQVITCEENQDSVILKVMF